MLRFFLSKKVLKKTSNQTNESVLKFSSSSILKNRVFLGAIAGVVATVVKDILNQGLYSLRIIKTLFAQYAVGMFVKPMETKSILGIVVGYFIDFGLSALLGIIFVFLLKKTKPHHLLFQGFMFGIVMFLGIYGASLSLGISSVKERALTDVVLMIFIHLIYGLILGLFVQKYGEIL